MILQKSKKRYAMIVECTTFLKITNHIHSVEVIEFLDM